MHFPATSVKEDYSGISFSSNDLLKYRLKGSLWHNYFVSKIIILNFIFALFFNRSVTCLKFVTILSMS